MSGRPRRVVVVGDTLLDRDLDGRVERLAPDAPVPVIADPVTRSRPGGAGLAAVLIAADGREVTLVTALADDEAGRQLRTLLQDAGVAVADLGLDGRTPEKVRVRTGGHPYVRLDYGDAAPAVVGPLTDAARTALEQADAVLVADYGRGVSAEPTVRAVLGTCARTTPLVWDPHPRGADPVPGARLVTPNRAEAERLVGAVDGHPLAQVTQRAQQLRERWAAGGVVVTLGAQGALHVGGDGTPLAVPVPASSAEAAGARMDPCGAGDRFASAAAGLLADGALPSAAVTGAVAVASAFVAAGGASSITIGSLTAEERTDPTVGSTPLLDAGAVIERTRAVGGTVVATGGCFDLLHAGHVAVLQAARALGDCLVVLLNSDDSVRRLKGDGRPVMDATDRARVLCALGCVDAVAVFDEDTPERLLRELRPDVWAKGADYAVEDLPEAAALRSWGGQAVVLPFVEGRSTTAILEHAAGR